MSNLSLNIEDILDKCILALRDQGATPAECLIDYPDHRAELEPLLQISTSLMAVQGMTAPPEFREVAVTRMKNLISAYPRRSDVSQTAMAPLIRPERRLTGILPTRRWRPAFSVLAVVIVMWLMVGSGVVYGANKALPGDTLYPVKRSVETTQLVLTTNTAKEAKLHLQFADKRLDELAIVMQENRQHVMGDVLSDYETHVGAVSVFLDTGAELTPMQLADLAKLIKARLEQHQTRLSELLSLAPPELQAGIESAMSAVQAGYDQALELLGAFPEEELFEIVPTRTPPPVPSITPVPPTIETPDPVPTPVPVTPVKPIVPTPLWHYLAGWPEECPIPNEWRHFWPEDCPAPPIWPEHWPTPPGGWPTPPPIPTIPAIPTWVVPPNWPEGCPLPPDWPPTWPEGCPLPSEWDWPPDWPIPPGDWQTPPPPPEGDDWVTSPDQLPPPPDGWEWDPPPDDGDTPPGWDWP